MVGDPEETRSGRPKGRNYRGDGRDGGADGRLVVPLRPLRPRGSVSRSIVLEGEGRHWRSRFSEMCTFMPLRASIADDPCRVTLLTPEKPVVLQADEEQAMDVTALNGVLDQPRSKMWTAPTTCPKSSARPANVAVAVGSTRVVNAEPSGNYSLF